MIAGLAALPLAFIFGVIGISAALVNPGHVLNNGKGVLGCQRQALRQGWQTQGWRGGQYDRPRCVKDGMTVWCDEVCHAPKSGKHPR